MEVPIEDFSMEPYTQEVDTHIPFLSDEDYSKALLTPAYQQQQLKQKKFQRLKKVKRQEEKL